MSSPNRKSRAYNQSTVVYAPYIALQITPAVIINHLSDVAYWTDMNAKYGITRETAPQFINYVQTKTVGKLLKLLSSIDKLNSELNYTSFKYDNLYTVSSQYELLCASDTYVMPPSDMATLEEIFGLLKSIFNELTEVKLKRA